MHEFSTVDGFVEISESLADMIKYLANEPSVGLFYVQQHAQNAVHNVIKIKSNVSEKSRETALHTEDFEDSIVAVRSMKECGSHVVQGMIGDINRTLAVMSVKEQRRGFKNGQHSGFGIGKGSSWSPASWGRSSFSSQAQLETGISGNYISTVFKSAKEKASNLKWAPLDLIDRPLSRSEETPSASEMMVPVTAMSAAISSLLIPEKNDPSAPNCVELKQQEKTNNEGKIPSKDLLLLAEEYDEFEADRETKLRDWLEGNKSSNTENGESRT